MSRVRRSDVGPHGRWNVEVRPPRSTLSPSSAIQAFYRQLMTCRALPFTPRASSHRPLFLDEITGNRLAEELEKGSESIRRGDVLSADEGDTILSEDFGA